MRRAFSSIRRAARCRSGTVALMFAMFLPIAVMCLGLAVDLMMLFTERRKAQGAADIAAIIAAQAVTDPESAAREILAINGYDVVSSVELGRLEEEEKQKAVETKTRFEVIPGRYTPDPDKGYGKRFVAGQTPYNAARVNVQKKGKFYFVGNLFEAPTVSVSATASRRALAAFSVGSRLVKIDDGLLNALLSALTGADIELSVLDYEGLMETDIDVFSFLDALASELDIEAGRYEDVLKSDPALSDVTAAMLEVSGDGPARDGIAALQSAVDGLAGEIDLAKVIDLGPAGKIALGEPAGAGLPAFVSAFDLVFANAVVADGERFLQLDLAASAPGLTSLVAAIEIGEPMQSSPWLSIGEAGQTVSNVQARIYIEASVGGTGLLSGINVRLPFYMELARAHGALSSVECPGGKVENIIVRVNGSSSVADAWIGDVTVTSSYLGDTVDKARLVSAPGVSIYAKAHAGTEAPYMQTLDFTWNDISSGTIKTTHTEEAAGLLIENLIEDLDVEANVLGLPGLSSGDLTVGALNNALGVLTAPVNDATDQLLAALGVSLGEGEFRVNGAKCDRAVLVQ